MPGVSERQLLRLILLLDRSFRVLLLCIVCIQSLNSPPLPARSKRVASAETVAEVERRHAQLAAAQHKLEKAQKQVTATTGSRILEQARARVAAAKRQLATTVLGSRAHKDAIKRVAVAQVW